MLVRRTPMWLFTLATHTSTTIAACRIMLDGRISKDISLCQFDTDSSPFNEDFVKGTNLFFSSIVKYPCSVSMGDNTTAGCPPSRFSTLESSKPIEVTISDQSIFAPGNGRPQKGFRRAELLLRGNDGKDESVRGGVRAYHWSVMQDPARPLNFSHDYLSVFLETNDFTARPWELRTGNALGDAGTIPKGLETLNWRFNGRAGKPLWQTPIIDNAFQNFAVVVDYEKNKLQLWYSVGPKSLKAVTDAMDNDNQGGGQWHIGLLKHPTESKDVAYEGFQESGIDEGLIYSDIFVEDGVGGCLST